MAYELPPLPYDYNALEPHIDEQTMRLHHDKHHAGYVTGLNTTLEKLEQARANGDFSGVAPLLKNLAFHGSGHVLHSIFWTNMKPNGGGQPSGEIAGRIERDFGSSDALRGQFLGAANTIPGSGWAILGWHNDLQKLLVLQTHRHMDLTVWGITPLLVLDMWEHAFYLNYQNRKTDYSQAFFDNLVNWDNVNERFQRAKNG
ncbi:MAG: Superoxide dismutase [Mn] [Calditrichaeota bacterium]|nr:Superoxide dismutase [Mn] [Calditrichota bacterium]